MNRFADGTWPFHAAIPRNPKEWQVTYFDPNYKRSSRMLFATEKQARDFADKLKGTVSKLEPRGGYK